MPAPTNSDGLTLKQEKFVNAYIETNGNGTRAAQQAGYKSNGVALRSVASQNLTKVNVQQAITKKLSSVMDGQEVLERFTKIARHEPKDIRASDVNKALGMLAEYHGIVSQGNTVNITLTHWIETIAANAHRKGIPEAVETATVLALPSSVVPEDVRAELAKRIENIDDNNEI